MPRVKSIKYIGKQDVYDMEVETHHNFSVNGGLIVHNSGFGLIAWHSRNSLKPPEPKKEVPWPLRTEESERKGVRVWLKW